MKTSWQQIVAGKWLLMNTRWCNGLIDQKADVYGLQCFLSSKIECCYVKKSSSVHISTSLNLRLRLGWKWSTGGEREMREVVSGLSRVLRQPFCLLLPRILEALASWVSSISIESLVTGKYSLLLSTGRVLDLVKLNRTSGNGSDKTQGKDNSAECSVMNEIYVINYFLNAVKF